MVPATVAPVNAKICGQVTFASVPLITHHVMTLEKQPKTLQISEILQNHAMEMACANVEVAFAMKPVMVEAR